MLGYMQKVKRLANQPCNNFSRIPDYKTTIFQRYRQPDGRTDRQLLGAYVRAGPSFHLGTLTIRIANLLCITLVNVVT